ncbi:MAG: zinc transporter ZupT [Bacillota bacterium]|nr:zinc transporter ZupT [Bacillota bacterium]MDD3298852.1 zinc transporter ZupT [Bacillota bacterium]MDD4708361.1 zinc transporter ZupT [Bacillota bacterium]
MGHSNIWLAFGLTLFAGLSTGIGSLIGFASKEFNPKFLSGALGFSAGVMIYVSFVEILVEAKDLLNLVYGVRKGSWITAAAFFTGIAVIAVIDKLVPSFHNPHEVHSADEYETMSEEERQKLMRMGLFSALAIAVHNFPEGLATFMSALSDPALGISIAVAIAIHNIPEGLAVSAPIYYATKNRKKAFILSFLSGLSEPVGALVGYFILKPIFNDTTLGFVFASVAGIMVYISLDELLPTAEEYGEHHVAISGVIAGMAVMAVSLLLFI